MRTRWLLTHDNAHARLQEALCHLSKTKREQNTNRRQLYRLLRVGQSHIELRMHAVSLCGVHLSLAVGPTTNTPDFVGENHTSVERLAGATR